IAQQDGAIDQAGQRIGLRIIAPSLERGDVAVLREETRAGAPGQHVLEQLARLFSPAGEIERLDQPEGAEIERRLGTAEIILAGVAQDIVAAPKIALDVPERGEEARIVRREE